HDKKDQNEDPPVGSDRGLKKRKTSKDVEPLKGSKSKESKSSSSKGSVSQSKSSGKSAQAEDQCLRLYTSRCHKIKEVTWVTRRINPMLRKLLSMIGKPPTTFGELMSTPIDFSAYVLHNMKIKNLTQEHLVGKTFNLLKGTCKSRVELEFHFEECYKAVTDKLDWTNPEEHILPKEISDFATPVIESTINESLENVVLAKSSSQP
nr:hypothetical protein [Tanacetum cinerariifolium]